jgi:hypothetical protein
MTDAGPRTAELAPVGQRYGTFMMLELERAAPSLLFGLRLWASVCLALWIAFALELDNPFWAGTSAAVVAVDHWLGRGLLGDRPLAISALALLPRRASLGDQASQYVKSLPIVTMLKSNAFHRLCG